MPVEYPESTMRYDTYVKADGTVVRVPLPVDRAFIDLYREEESVKIPKPNEVKFTSQVKMEQELAEWEKELLGMKPVGYTTEDGLKQEFYMGPSQRFMAGKEPKSNGTKRVLREDAGPGCGDYECDFCYQYEDNPDCEGCKRRDQQIKDLKENLKGMEDRDNAHVQRAEEHAEQMDAMRANLDEATKQRNEFDNEADLLAIELERVTDQRDEVMRQLLWSEEQLLAAWQQLEHAKSA